MMPYVLKVNTIDFKSKELPRKKTEGIFKEEHLRETKNVWPHHMH